MPATLWNRQGPAIITPRTSQRPRWPFTVNYDSPQADGLVAWWPFIPFGDDLIQLHPKATNLTATLTDMDPATDWVRDEEFGHALDFAPAAASDFVDITPSNTDPLQMGSGSFTILAWANSRSGNGNGRRIFLNGSLTNRYELYIDAVIRLTLVVDDNTTQTTAAGATADWTNNTWHHAAGVRDATAGTLRVYVDAVEEADVTDNTGDVDESGTSTTIGALTGSTTTHWDGLMADVRVYNTAVPPAVIHQAWNPRTRWDLYYELKRVYYSFPPAVLGTGWYQSRGGWW